MFLSTDMQGGGSNASAEKTTGRNYRRDAIVAAGVLVAIAAVLGTYFSMSKKPNGTEDPHVISAAGWIRDRTAADAIPESGDVGTSNKTGYAPTQEELAKAAPATTTSAVNPSTLVKEGTVRKGVPVISSLTKLGLTNAQAHTLIASLDGIYDFKTARPGQQFEVHLDPITLGPSYLRYDVSLTEVYEVKKLGDRLVGSRKHIPTRKKIVRYGGTISSSLYKAVNALGAHPSLPGKIVDVLTNQVDFFKAQRPGDSFRVIIEEERLKDSFIGYGPLLALEYRGSKSGKKRLFLFRKDGEDTYYNEKGISIPKTLLTMPLHFSRISSQFGTRYHPILRRRQFHSGVDFAASRGTPVWACKSGHVTFAARKGANGNLVVVDHGENLKSYYAHLSRFGRGIRSGVKVRRRQVIGYVGSTGRSTGPHLHFGVKQGSRFVDPLKYKIQPGRPVPSKYRKELFDRIAGLSKQLNNTRVRPPAAPIQKTPETEQVLGVEDL